jgi:hypothetical protein
MRTCKVDPSHVQTANHTFNIDGYCRICDYQCPHVEYNSESVCSVCKAKCRHKSTRVDYKLLTDDDTKHIEITICNACQKEISVRVNGHKYNEEPGLCKCGVRCDHENVKFTEKYISKSYDYHLYQKICNKCGMVTQSEVQRHDDFNPKTIKGKKYCSKCSQVYFEDSVDYEDFSETEHIKIDGSLRTKEKHDFVFSDEDDYYHYFVCTKCKKIKSGEHNFKLFDEDVLTIHENIYVDSNEHMTLYTCEGCGTYRYQYERHNYNKVVGTQRFIVERPDFSTTLAGLAFGLPIPPSFIPEIRHRINYECKCEGRKIEVGTCDGIGKLERKDNRFIVHVDCSICGSYDLVLGEISEEGDMTGFRGY